MRGTPSGGTTSNHSRSAPPPSRALYSLRGAPLSVGDIAETVGATQSAVSHQLRILKQARLVRFNRDGRSVIYSLADDHVHTMLAQGMTHICE